MGRLMGVAVEVTKEKHKQRPKPSVDKERVKMLNKARRDRIKAENKAQAETVLRHRQSDQSYCAY